MKSNTYYINENENVINFFVQNDIEISKSIVNQISFISNKTSNNYVGFYQFLINDEYIKFFIIPKLFENEDNKTKEKGFINFLSRYYSLSNKYSEINNNPIRGNIVDLIIKDEEEIEGAGIDDFLQKKYEYALNRLDRFFRKHNKKQKTTTLFSSQAVKARLDLRRNITNIDKSNIYQIKTEEQAHSKIAFIAEQALIHFEKEKLELLSINTDKLINKTRSVLNTIQKKYKKREKGIFKDRDIISYKIVKLFRKSNELLEVYDALLTIIGLEHYKNDKQTSEIQKIPNMTALFFRPEDLYEWIVYDKLVSNNNKANILRKNDGIEYQLLTNKENKKRYSKPDFVIIDNDLVTIIDAKWKILKDISNIQFSDIAKLERDYILRKEISETKKVKAQLIYPKIDFDYESYNVLKHSYSDIEFEIKKIGIAETKEKESKEKIDSIIKYLIVPENEVKHYENCVPLIPLEAAAGNFSKEQEISAGEYDWITWEGHPKFEKDMFVAKVIGKSMEPDIQDESHCLFRQPQAGTRNGKTLLVWHSGVTDTETGGQYTVKIYESEKKDSKEGEWEHKQITLKPINPEFEPIILKPEEKGEVLTIAEFVEVVG